LLRVLYQAYLNMFSQASSLGSASLMKLVFRAKSPLAPPTENSVNHIFLPYFWKAALVLLTIMSAFPE